MIQPLDVRDFSRFPNRHPVDDPDFTIGMRSSIYAALLPLGKRMERIAYNEVPFNV